MELLIEIIKAFWFILPAYGANAFPPLMKGKRPIDFGKKLGKERI
ncbi:MAG: CDP-archaeol synthase, partial [Candidatus Aenigmatarchaeota archaeon]